MKSSVDFVEFEGEEECLTVKLDSSTNWVKFIQAKIHDNL